MCAFFLLSKLKEARKILKASIEKDYLNYYVIKEWPAVSQEELDQFTYLEKVAEEDLKK
ncbi:hypothetical protein [Arsenophonus endosymbiont of Crataerina pallida]